MSCLQGIAFVAGVLLCQHVDGEPEMAPFIKPFRKEDSACIIHSAQAAIPEFARGIVSLGVNALDPMVINEINSEAGGLQVTFTKSKVTGLKNAIIEQVRQEESNFFLQIRVPEVHLNGDYTLDGELSVFPISGTGRYTIRLRDIVLNIKLDMAEKKGSDEKTHWELQDYDYNYDIKDDERIVFHNLFNGKNPDVARILHHEANTNWKQVVEKVGKPIVKSIVNNVVEETKKFFNMVPLSELVLNIE